MIINQVYFKYIIHIIQIEKCIYLKNILVGLFILY